MATKDERNAAFDAVKAKVEELIKALAVWPYEGRFEAALNDPKNTKYILSIVDAALTADEKARAAVPKG